MVLSDYNNHLCPECGHKIGIHTDSPFGHNPLNSIGLECGRSRNSLTIDILTAWWKDALGERDAYAKSYEIAKGESNNYFNSFLNMTTVAADAVADREALKKKLKLAMKALDDLDTFDFTYSGVKDIVKRAKAEIEKIK